MPFDVLIDRKLSRPYIVVDEVGCPVRQYDSLAAAWHHAVWSEHTTAGLLPVVGPGGWFRSGHAKTKADAWTSDPRYAATMPRAEATPEQIKAAEEAATRFIRAHVSADPLEVFRPVTDFDWPDIANEDWERFVTPTDEDEMDAAAEKWAAEQEAAERDTPKLDALMAEEPIWAEKSPESDSESLENEGGAITPEDPSEAVSDESPATQGHSRVDPDYLLRTGYPDAISGIDYDDTEERQRELYESLTDAQKRAFDNWWDLAENAETDTARAFWTEYVKNWLSELVA